jgi:hypothetical protein
MNKKGDLSVYLFVVLLVVDLSAILFIFHSSSVQANAMIVSPLNVEKVYSQEELAEFYIKDAGERAFVKTYKEFVSNEKYDYIEQPVEIVDGYSKFNRLDDKLEENFNKRFEENFKELFLSYEFEKSFLNEVKGLINEDKFEFKDGVLSVNGLILKSVFEDIEIFYEPVLEVKLDNKRIGFASFEEIYRFKEKCADSEEIVVCYEDNEKMVYGFDIQYEDFFIDDYYLILYFESERDFFIDDGFEKIKFSFVVG